MKFSAILAAFGLALAFAAGAHAEPAQSLDGRWQGKVMLPSKVEVSAVFRIETKNGKTSVVFDNPILGATDSPVTLKRQGDKLTFEVPEFSISYVATLSADGQTLTGQFDESGGVAPLTMVRKAATAAAPVLTSPAVAGLDGRWEGPIVTPRGSIAGVIRISTKGDRTTTFLDSPDQGDNNIPAVTKRDGQTVTIEVPSITGTYTAQLSADGASLTGQWSQNGQSFPLNMIRKK